MPAGLMTKKDYCQFWNRFSVFSEVFLNFLYSKGKESHTLEDIIGFLWALKIA